MSGSDSWASASVISGASGSTTGDNTGYTSESGEPIPSEGPGDGPWQSVWWKWIAPATGAFFFSTQGSRKAGGSGLDTVLGVYHGGALASLVEDTSNDDGDDFSGADGLNSYAFLDATSGTTYYIQVSGFDSSEYGSIDLSWGELAASDTPVITSPAAGAVYTPGDNIIIPFTWTESDQVAREIDLSGLSVSLTGTSDHSSDVHVRYPTGGSLTLRVRARQTGGGWSSWAEVTVTVTADVDTPMACLRDELVADAPEFAWLPIEGFFGETGWSVSDVSGNNDYAQAADDTPHDVSGSGGEAHSNATVTDSAVFYVNPADLTSAAVGKLMVAIIVSIHDTNGTSPNIVDDGTWTIQHQTWHASAGDPTHVVYSMHVATRVFTAGDIASPFFPFHFDTVDRHTVLWKCALYENFENNPIAFGEAYTASGNSLTLPDLDGSANPGDDGYAEAIHFTPGFGGLTLTGSPGWGNLDSFIGGAATHWVNDGWYKRSGSGVTISSAGSPVEMWGVNFIMRNTVERVVLDESGFCDSGCDDAIRSAVNPTPVLVRDPGGSPLHGLAAWTLLLAAEPHIPDSWGSSDGPMFSIGTDNGFLLLELSSLSGAVPNGRAQVDTALDFISFSVNDPGRDDTCTSIAAIVYDQSDPEPLKLFLNHQRASVTTDPGPVSISATNHHVVEIPSSFSLAALYTYALPRKRLFAYMQHLCRCGAGGGFTLGGPALAFS